MKKVEDETISPEQEKYLLQSFPGIHKFISRKLGAVHKSSVEDVRQRVFLKLWRWKKEKCKRNLSEEEWQKIAHVTARNEVTEFFREKYTSRDIVFSQMSEKSQKTIFSISSTEILEGNTRTELCSLLMLVWKSAKTLTRRQKYTYFLHFPDFIVEFIVCRCCSIEELASYFETSETELSRIINKLPVSDEEIGKCFEKIFGEKLSPKQIWESRAKTKRKLAKKLSEYISDERLSLQRGT